MKTRSFTLTRSLLTFVFLILAVPVAGYAQARCADCPTRGTGTPRPAPSSSPNATQIINDVNERTRRNQEEMRVTIDNAFQSIMGMLNKNSSRRNAEEEAAREEYEAREAERRANEEAIAAERRRIADIEAEREEEDRANEREFAYREQKRKERLAAERKKLEELERQKAELERQKEESERQRQKEIEERKARMETAYAYYFVKWVPVGKDLSVAVITTPLPFEHEKGSSYLFAPADLRSRAQKGVGVYLGSLTVSPDALAYVSEIEESALVGSMEDAARKVAAEYEKATQERANMMRATNVRIVLIDAETGNLLQTFELPKSPARRASGARRAK